MLSFWSECRIESSDSPCFLVVLRYILYWRKRFAEQPVTDFCSVIRINSTAPLGECTSWRPCFLHNPKLQRNKLTFLDRIFLLPWKLKLNCCVMLRNFSRASTSIQGLSGKNAAIVPLLFVFRGWICISTGMNPYGKTDKSCFSLALLISPQKSRTTIFCCVTSYRKIACSGRSCRSRSWYGWARRARSVSETRPVPVATGLWLLSDIHKRGGRTWRSWSRNKSTRST